MGIRQDLQDFGKGFPGIHEVLGEDLWGFARLCQRICRIHETLGEDSKGVARICETLGEDSRDFGRGFVRLWERIREDSQDFGRGFMGIREDS